MLGAGCLPDATERPNRHRRTALARDDDPLGPLRMRPHLVRATLVDNLPAGFLQRSTNLSVLLRHPSRPYAPIRTRLALSRRHRTSPDQSLTVERFAGGSDRLCPWLWSRYASDSGRCCVTVLQMSALKFNVVYEDAGAGWVYAHVPELPEVQTQGEDLEQARSMVLDAISMVLDERRARGESIPQPGWALVESVEIAA